MDHELMGSDRNLHSPVYARERSVLLSALAHYLIYLKKADCKEDLPLTSPLCYARLLLTVGYSDMT